jgi:hypothetical protein
MRISVNFIKDCPHAEERPWARLEARKDAGSLKSVRLFLREAGVMP